MSNSRVVISTTGVKYEVVSFIGQGGFGSTYKAKRMSDGKPCVLKLYDNENDPSKIKAIKLIRRNLYQLHTEPVIDPVTKKRCPEVIGPMDKGSFYEAANSSDRCNFGYVMRMVDTNRFLPLDKFRKTADVEAFCKAGKEFARVFRIVHAQGLCYKDINAGNLFLDPKTGEVRIIDCDNIGLDSVRTVLGTPGFIAPEVYKTCTPDKYSDYFSMALFFFKLFFGGHPLLGKRALDYMYKNNYDLMTAQPHIFGTDALFIFDPVDSSNSVRNCSDPSFGALFKIEQTIWDILPDKLKDAFIKTLSKGIKEPDKQRRFTDREWYQLFDDLLKNNIASCPACGKRGFADREDELGGKRSNKICWACGAQMPVLPKLNTNNEDEHKKLEPKGAVFEIRRDIDSKVRTLTIERKKEIKKSIHNGIPEINKSGWFQILYLRKRNILVAKNNTTLTWKVTMPGHHPGKVPPGEVFGIRKGMTIIIKDKMLEMKVAKIEYY